MHSICTRHHPDRQRGFTLIEVLLAVGLLAIIMGMAYSGFHASVRASNSGEEIIEQTNRLRVVQQFMRGQLLQALSLIIEETDDGEQVRFQGEGDHVRFVSPMPGYLSYGGPYVQEFALERGRNGQELVYYYAMLNGYEPGDLHELTDGHVLLENLRGGEFIFLDLDEETGDPFWVDWWEETERLPLAVGIMLEFDDSVTSLSWPDLIVPVMVDSTRMERLGSSRLQPGQPSRMRRR